MRVALAGKGGAGKTTIAATLCRLLARRGLPVVAVDADSSPNLRLALGMPDAAPAAIPTSLVSRRLGGTGLVRPVAEVLDEHALTGPDGVRLLHMGSPAHAEEGCLCSAHATVSALLEDLGRDRWTVVDLEASPEHLSRGTARHVDLLLLVAEPYYRALEAVTRLAALAAELPIPDVVVVANKVRRPADAEAVAEHCARHGLRLLGAVPWDDEVLAGDAAAQSLIDRGASPAVLAVEALAETLLTEAATRSGIGVAS